MDRDSRDVSRQCVSQNGVSKMQSPLTFISLWLSLRTEAEGGEIGGFQIRQLQQRIIRSVTYFTVSIFTFYEQASAAVSSLQIAGRSPPLSGQMSPRFWVRSALWVPPSPQVPECIICLPSPTPPSPPATAHTCHLLLHHLLLHWAIVVLFSQVASTMDRISSSTPSARTATLSQHWII